MVDDIVLPIRWLPGPASPGEARSLAALAICHWLWLSCSWLVVFHFLFLLMAMWYQIYQPSKECSDDPSNNKDSWKKIKPQACQYSNPLFSDVGHCWSVSMCWLCQQHDMRRDGLSFFGSYLESVGSLACQHASDFVSNCCDREPSSEKETQTQARRLVDWLLEHTITGNAMVFCCSW